MVLKVCPQYAQAFRSRDNRPVCCSRRCARLYAGKRLSARTCPTCQNAFQPRDHRQIYCSVPCRAKAQINRYQAGQHPNWKTGRYIINSGYVRIRMPGHPRATPTGYVLEHIVVMEAKLGRSLLPTERVHHLNGRRDDDRPENLELWRIKDPPGVRSADYHCPGCSCGEQTD